jgi:hypothetical protein
MLSIDRLCAEAARFVSSEEDYKSCFFGVALKHNKLLASIVFISISILRDKRKSWRNQQRKANKQEIGQSKTVLAGIGAIFPQEKGLSVRSNPCQDCFAGSMPVRCRGWILGLDTRWPNRRPVRHRDMRLRFGIIADSSRLRPEAVADRMDPGFWSVRLPDAEGCGRRRGIGDKGDDAHAAAAGATQRVCFEDFFNQTSPRAACFPGAIRIVALVKYRCRQAGAFSICRIEANPAAVGIGAIESLTMSSRIRDMGRDAVNPCEWVHLHGPHKQILHPCMNKARRLKEGRT